MSKIDAMRAMREAKYAERHARAGASGATPARRVGAPPAVAPTVPPRSAAATTDARPSPATVMPDATEALCGHRSMNGRTCTREQGHAAKSHRYG